MRKCPIYWPLPAPSETVTEKGRRGRFPPEVLDFGGRVKKIARVAIPVPLHEPFDYLIPEEMIAEVRPGTPVLVPFGPTRRYGWVTELTDQSPHPKLRKIHSVVTDGATLSEELLSLLDWTARYYVCGIGEAIETALPKPVRERKVRQVRWVRAQGPASPTEKGGGADARNRVLEYLQHHPKPIPLRRLVEECGISDSPVKTLEKKGLVEVFDGLPPEFGVPGESLTSETPWDQPAPFEPNGEQQAAIDRIREQVFLGEYCTFLLHGVTGSGKTEVYIRAAQSALASGKGVLVLLPEIALTPQAIERFTERLGPVAVLHSMLSDTERAVHHERLRCGEVKLALGARSAVFAPVQDLGLIIVDESHESSYKQENSPRYHARDVAVMRAHQLGIPCVLGSATPSMESLENSRQGRYEKLTLQHRVSDRSMATIEIIDRRQEKGTGDSSGLLSRRLIDLIRQTLDRQEQVLLFLNRRGFARDVNCRQCGYSFRCGSCDIPMTYHKHRDLAQCHYCAEQRRIPDRCPQCHFTGLHQRSPGTERVEETLISLFPGTTVDRLDRDTVTSGRRMVQILQRFRDGETQILVGTQMVAKGHDIPGVTLVGVLDADVALGLPDFRSAERTAQLLCQVAGRAGRGDSPGRVALQTRQPDHYAIACAVHQDLDQLLEHENSVRQMLHYPPHGYLARIVFEDEDEKRNRESADQLVRSLTDSGNQYVQILGPAPAPLEKLRGRFRLHILLKSPSRESLREVGRLAQTEKPRWSSTRVTLDIDPQNLL